jgi:hypothetical protein
MTQEETLNNESQRKPRRRAVKLTDIDRKALELIERNSGWIGVNRINGEPFLEFDLPEGQTLGKRIRCIGRDRLERLVFLELLEPADDKLFDDVGQPQTYRLKPAEASADQSSG